MGTWSAMCMAWQLHALAIDFQFSAYHVIYRGLASIKGIQATHSLKDFYTCSWHDPFRECPPTDFFGRELTVKFRCSEINKPRKNSIFLIAHACPMLINPIITLWSLNYPRVQQIITSQLSMHKKRLFTPSKTNAAVSWHPTSLTCACTPWVCCHDMNPSSTQSDKREQHGPLYF